LSLPESVKQQITAHAAQVEAAQKDGALAPRSDPAEATPALVDNRRFQGPIRDQGGRGTCVSFSTCAAIEAAYRRLDPIAFKDLDLSEQWANHLQKMISLAGAYGSDHDSRAPGAEVRENQPGCWGGSWDDYLLRVLQKYGVPEEGAMAYNP